MLSVVGGLRGRETVWGVLPDSQYIIVYHQVINIFINSLCVELRPASDHFISPPWAQYCSCSIISLIYILPCNEGEGSFLSTSFCRALLLHSSNAQ